MSFLKVDNLNVYYGNIHALKGISLEVGQGELVSLIGANGAGKTTTLQAISGLLPVKAGDISFKNDSILKLKAYKRTRMGIAQVPEGRRVFAGISVEDNLMLGGVSVNATTEDDKKELDIIYDLFPVLKEEGRTILLVEQNAKLALDIADRGYVIETGKIVKEGNAKELKNDPDVKAAYLGI